MGYIPFTCSKGHTSMRRANTVRSHPDSCGVCTGMVFVSGVNDLATTHPAIAKEWSDLNDKAPEEFHAGAKVKVFWDCPIGHRWECRIATRTKIGTTCHFCSGKFLLSGFNDLATLWPTVAEEWAPENPITASEVKPQSQIKFDWICRICSHQWTTTPQKRVLGSQCPSCSRNERRSKGERELGAWIEQQGFDILPNDVKVLDPFEIDVWMPSLNLGIEYQGDYWHGANYVHSSGATASQRALWKLSRAKKANIRLFYVWESDWKLRRETVEIALKRLLTTGYATAILRKPIQKPTSNDNAEEQL